MDEQFHWGCCFPSEAYAGVRACNSIGEPGGLSKHTHSGEEVSVGVCFTAACRSIKWLSFTYLSACNQ